MINTITISDQNKKARDYFEKCGIVMNESTLQLYSYIFIAGYDQCIKDKNDSDKDYILNELYRRMIIINNETNIDLRNEMFRSLLKDL